MRYPIVFAFCLVVTLNAVAQRITINEKAISLPALFKEIRKQSGHDFLYNQSAIAQVGPIALQKKDATVQEVLDAALFNQPLQYLIEDKVVMITEKNTTGAKSGFAISGLVRNKQGETLPGAAVLVSNYQIGAVADNEGRFNLPQLRPGNYTLVIKMIGYQPNEQKVTISNRDIKLEIVLDEDVNVLREIVVKPDRYWLARMRVFQENFIGTSPNAAGCKILNPSVVSFEYDDEQRILKARADDFIVVENKALGYRIRYFLKYFERDDETQVVRFFGYPFFEELEESRAKRKKYHKKRETAYNGSPQHFFSALFSNTYADHGFVVNRMIKSKNPEKLSDSLINRKIEMFTKEVKSRKERRRRMDSLALYLKMKSAPDTVEILIREDIPTHELVKRKSAVLREIDFKDALYVTYKGERETKSYAKYSGYKIKRPDDLAPYQVSLVYRTAPEVNFFENGAIYDPGSLLYEGMWGYERVADMLPLDYQAEP
ncbi:carboxypeptidase-like regulatory domain-containing protein [Pedobacter faecalis]|uniref:carboxypeptidase-like regulatory domain-containing protein n=1 Tax=Pedobacter faecalis TaxID=3041495 RepID=UPI00254DB6B0|nr:carboxypeptidase-like regulatory domain-containing protein [Pedobacter sp. ELA7]